MSRLIYNFDIYMYCFILAINAYMYPDDYAVFHLDLHGLPNDLFAGIQNER